jgi:hypothetical protein
MTSPAFLRCDSKCSVVIKHLKNLEQIIFMLLRLLFLKSYNSSAAVLAMVAALAELMGGSKLISDVCCGNSLSPLSACLRKSSIRL